METIIDGNHFKSEPLPVSKTSGLHIIERPTELGGTDFKRVEGKCGHFSIRGYVTEIRRRDWKISWPFLTCDEDYKLGDHAHWLPPMSVSEFRWWRCPNCLRKAGADTDGGVLHCFCDVQDDAQKFPSGFQQASNDNFFDERKGNEDATANLNSGECHSSLCTDAKEKEISALCQSKDGVSNHIGQSCEPVSHSPHKEPYVLDSSSDVRKKKHVHDFLSSKKPIFYENSTSEAETLNLVGNEPLHDRGCTRDGAHNARLNIEFCVSGSNNASEFCCMDNVGFSGSHLVLMKERHDNITADYGVSQDVDISGGNDDPLNNITGPSSELDSMELYESNHDISENNEDLDAVDDCNQHIAGQFDTSNGFPHQKKARKTRLLTDIIKSEVSNASSKILIFNRDAEIKSIHRAADHSKVECDASKDLDLRSGLKGSLVVHKDDKKNVVRKKWSKTIRAEDKGSSLMSWLKDVAGKVKIPKRYGKGKQNKQIVHEASNSKSLLDASTKTRPSPCQSDLATRGSGKKVTLCKNQNKMTQFEDDQSFLTYCQEPISEKSKTTAGNAETKHIVTKNVQSKSSQDALPGLSARQGPNHRRAILSKKKKLPRVEDGTSAPTNWLKDSLATSNCDSTNKLQVHKKASKKHKQKTGKTCEQDSLDDIPMEIVELMAKNQHERHLLNADDTTKNTYKMPETIANVNLPYILDFTEVSGMEASGFLQENSPAQKTWSSNAGNGVCATGKKMRKPGKKPNGNTCRKDDTSLLSTNQLERSMPFSQCQESPLSGVHFPAAASGVNPDRWSLTCMQSVEAHQQNRTVPPWSSCGQPYERLQIPSKCLPFDINIPHRVDDLCHKGVVFHCPDPSSKRNKDSNNHGSCGSKSMRSDLTRHLQKKKEEVLSETNNKNPPVYAYSSMEQGNKCLPMMGPLDLYTNEAISAMNLLRLMDQGARSSTPVDMSMVRKQANPLENPESSHNHQHKELIGSGDGVVMTDRVSMCPRSFEIFDQNHCLGSPFKLSPMRKIGELSCSSHKVAPDSNESRRHLGFINGLSKNTSSPKGHGKGKTKCSHSSIRTRGKSPLGFVAQDENRGKARKRILSVSHSIAQSINSGMTQSMTNCTVTEICTVNRNPAEFSIAGEGNEYMIGSEDLNCMDMHTSSDKLHESTNVDGHKRRRTLKLTAIQGN